MIQWITAVPNCAATDVADVMRDLDAIGALHVLVESCPLWSKIVEFWAVRAEAGVLLPLPMGQATQLLGDANSTESRSGCAA